MLASSHFRRCCDGHHDEPCLGRESAVIHDDSRFSKRIPRFLACVLSFWLNLQMRREADWLNDYMFYADGLSSIYREEGVRGWYRGTLLALVGVSNGAIQFMGYEQMKRLALEAKRKRYDLAGREWNIQADRLVCHGLLPLVRYAHTDHPLTLQSNTTYTLMSGASKLMALVITYPYQVVRSRIQARMLGHRDSFLPLTKSPE